MSLRRFVPALPSIFILVFAFLLVLTVGCGGSSNSNMGGGNPPPVNPPPSPPPPPVNPNANQWGWMGGSSTVGTARGGQPGVYGTQGQSAASDIPGGRAGAAVWKDASGNIWLFGGEGVDSAGNSGSLNDLWEFNPTAKQWTWIDGSNTTLNHGQPGVYGTEGVAAATNIPGGRSNAVSWIDQAGNLWLFGGQGFDSQDNNGYLNDLWEFNTTSKQWTWVSGSDTIGSIQNGGQAGVYGTKGTPSTANVPGGRTAAVGWIDGNGDLWLFGGFGLDGEQAPQTGDLNDLWEFNPTAGTWTWVSGSNTLVGVGLGSGSGVVGVYGTKGTAAAQNVPGGREDATGWADASGNFWLFGGYGPDSKGDSGELNDLWQFNAATQQWVWVSGSDTAQGAATNPPSHFVLVGDPGVYGTQGTASTANAPGSRQDAIAWVDPIGNFWIFGGQGFDSVSLFGYLDDLWEFNPTADAWTWMGGSDTETPTSVLFAYPYTSGVYGTMGTPATGDVPGSRSSPVSWVDSSGNLWLFGGYGADSTGTEGYLNDMWEYMP